MQRSLHPLSINPKPSQDTTKKWLKSSAYQNLRYLYRYWPLLATKFSHSAPLPIFQTLATHFDFICTPEEHERLRHKASRIVIRPKETIDKYIDRHLAVWQEMSRAALPVIQDEHITVNFIIRGLSARPRLHPHITLLLTSRPATLREARQLIELVNTTLHQAAAQTRSSPSI